MALIYPTIWEQGDKKERLSPGYHYKKYVKSIGVPEGQVVTFYANEDRQGEVFANARRDLSPLGFYGVEDRPGCIRIEETSLTEKDHDPGLLERTLRQERQVQILSDGLLSAIGDRKYGRTFRTIG